MDGWVIGIVEDTIDEVDRNDPSSSDALRTGKVIPNSFEFNEELRLLEEPLHRYLQPTYYHRTHSFFSA